VLKPVRPTVPSGQIASEAIVSAQTLHQSSGKQIEGGIPCGEEAEMSGGGWKAIIMRVAAPGAVQDCRSTNKRPGYDEATSCSRSHDSTSYPVSFLSHCTATSEFF